MKFVVPNLQSLRAAEAAGKFFGGNSAECEPVQQCRILQVQNIEHAFRDWSLLLFLERFATNAKSNYDVQYSDG